MTTARSTPVYSALIGGLALCTVLLPKNAAAGAVTVTGAPQELTLSEHSGATGNVTFTVNNGTGAAVELFAIVDTVTSSGDDLLDKADFGATDASDCRKNASVLAARAGCSILSPYTVLDKDPTDKMNPIDDAGVFVNHLDVAFGPVGGPVSGHALSVPDAKIIVTDDEPSGWSLLGMSFALLFWVRRASGEEQPVGAVMARA